MESKKSFIISDKTMFKLMLIGIDITICYFIRDIWPEKINSIFLSTLSSFINLNLGLLLLLGIGTSIAIGFNFINERINEFFDEKERFDSIKGQKYNLSAYESFKYDMDIYQYQLKLALEKEDYEEASRVRDDIKKLKEKMSSLKQMKDL